MARNREVVLAHASRAVNNAMDLGDRTHPNDPWINESVEHHLFHAYVHMFASATRYSTTDLEHAICRLAMAIAVREGTLRQ